MLSLKQVSTDSHFFNDLGAHSLLMARFCARVRQNAALSGIAMRDIYMNPTIERLAEHLDATVPPAAAIAAPPSPRAHALRLRLLRLRGAAGSRLCRLCRARSLDGAGASRWIYAAADQPFELYLRCVASTAGIFLALNALAIAAKWLVIGRWREESFPIWGLRYFRFWAVKTLVQNAPLALFARGPLRNLYLRLLGARIGRNAVIESRVLPVATDLFSVGDDAVLRANSVLPGYRAEANMIHIGRIEIGSGCYVGTASVLDINTRMGNRSQLAHASSLQSGQAIPAGRSYHGSPAVETDANYVTIEPRSCGRFRRALFAAAQLAVLFAVTGPFPSPSPQRAFASPAKASPASRSLAPPQCWFCRRLAFLLAASSLASPAIYVIPRLAHRFLEVGRTYPLYGLHHWLQQVIEQTSNSRFFNLMFGDSAFIVHYLRLVGWNLNKIEQTGSNFGCAQRHENPFLCEIGSGTTASDGLSIGNVHMSSSSFPAGRRQDRRA